MNMTRSNVTRVDGREIMRGVLALAFMIVSGCGGGAVTQTKNFSTSGNPEADQRADQRMSQAEQLSGDGEGAGQDSGLFKNKRSLYDRLGGQTGMSAIGDDFVTRATAEPRV